MDCHPHCVLEWLRLVCVASVALCAFAGAKPGTAAREMFIRHSDIVFPYTAPADVYRHYRATMVAWGFRPWRAAPGQIGLQWHRARDIAHSAHVRYQARVELDAGWRGWIDFAADPRESVCRSLEGKLLTYKAWTTTYKGHPAYHGCTNAPGYREYLRHQAKEALASDPDALLIDAIQCTPMTIWRAGCFCRWCMGGFREYLQAHVSPQTIAELEIKDLDSFDYGAFLRARGITDQQFSRQVSWYPAKLPLAQEFLTFQHLAAREFIADFRKRVEQMAGHSLPLSTSTVLLRPRDWWAYPVVDYFTIETPYRATERRVPEESVFRFKLADALDRRLLATAVPSWDWAYVRDHNLQGLVRTWIAQAYAYGHQFMVPHSMWCGEGEKARFESRTGDCDDLYRFVHRHIDLLDGYEPVANVGLLYSNIAFRRHHRQAQEACYQLTRENIPFRIVVAGDEWMPVKLDARQLAALEALVVTRPLILDPQQKALVDGAIEKTVFWPNLQRLPREIVVEGAKDVTVLPRAKRDAAGASFVCHLLNGNYDPETDSTVPQRDFTVQLSDSLFGAHIVTASMLAPSASAHPCPVETAGGAARICIPELREWAILKLDAGDHAPGA